MQKLKAAAERHLTCDYWSEDEYDNRSFSFLNEKLAGSDRQLLSTFAARLLSAAPVTAEWLREQWGADLACRIFGGPVGLCVSWSDDFAYTRIRGSIVAMNQTQGQFTMLALAIGLTPTEAQPAAVEKGGGE